MLLSGIRLRYGFGWGKIRRGSSVGGGAPAHACLRQAGVCWVSGGGLLRLELRSSGVEAMRIENWRAVTASRSPPRSLFAGLSCWAAGRHGAPAAYSAPVLGDCCVLPEGAVSRADSSREQRMEPELACGIGG